MTIGCLGMQFTNIIVHASNRLIACHPRPRILNLNEESIVTDQPQETAAELKEPAVQPSRFQTLRTWPAALLVLGIIASQFIPDLIENGPANIWAVGAFGPAVCAILILLWWLLVSRATWQERIIGFLGIVAAAGISISQLHPSMLGPGMLVVTIPMGIIAFACGTVLLRNVLSFRRTTIAILLSLIGFGFSTMLRTEGVWGNARPELYWRWEPSAEEKLVANKDARATVDIQSLQEETLDAGLTNPEWPGFRGPTRMGFQSGVEFATNWNDSPPEELWRIQVGPAWSSFALAGDLLFTQEQRGEMESIVCYEAASGAEVWTHEIQSRFFDPLGGPGPRATPTIAAGKLFAQGAEGWLLCLDAKTGDVIWKKDIREVAGVDNPPMWGFSASPLVVPEPDRNLVVAYGGGKGDKGTLAFDAEHGELVWSAHSGKMSYSSAQLCQVAGEDFIVMLSNLGMELLNPSTGDERLAYEWEHEGYRSLQPQIVGDSIIIPTGKGSGTRRVNIRRDGDQLNAEEMWTSMKLKPDFNDLVVHDGSVYGFDGKILACLDLETGEKQWKGGRYGAGQMLLLADSDALLVVSEFGEIVLVAATPEEHREIARIQAIEGKTWNHPVVVGDRLYLRNAQEAVCFKLPVTSE